MTEISTREFLEAIVKEFDRRHSELRAEDMRQFEEYKEKIEKVIATQGRMELMITELSFSVRWHKNIPTVVSMLALVVSAIVAILIWTHGSAKGHEALSGWLYPESCCGSTHCHQVLCDELLEQESGTWKWRDYTFPRSVVQPSQDKHCHVCVNGPLPLCAFVQQGA